MIEKTHKEMWLDNPDFTRLQKAIENILRVSQERKSALPWLESISVMAVSRQIHPVSDTVLLVK